jgi:hypothetical protein
MLTFDVNAEATCQVLKATPKVEQEGGGISWDVDLAYTLHDEAEVEFLTSIFPSAVTAYMRAVDSKSESLMKATVPDALCKLAMRLPGGEVLLEGASTEVRGVELKCGLKAQVYTMKLRLKYLRSDYWVNLVQSLGEHVIVHVIPSQQNLPLAAKTKLPPLGRVVCATEKGTGREVYGVFRGERGDGLVVEDFDVYYTCQDILSQLHVADADGLHIDTPIAKYAGMSEIRSWRSLVDALGESVAHGRAVGDATVGFEITDEEVRIALGCESQAYRNRA